MASSYRRSWKGGSTMADLILVVTGVVFFVLSFALIRWFDRI